MLEALLWGIVASSSLAIGGACTLLFSISSRVLGLVMAFGAGVLISSVAFELVEEAADAATGDAGVALGLFTGAGVFYIGDALLDRYGGDQRKSSGGEQASGSALAIVLGIVLDGIPESTVLGLTVLQEGSVSIAFLAAVFLSNLPEAVAATSGLASSGWRGLHILGLWTLVAVVCGFASLAGFAFLDSAGANTVAFVLSFAGGAILTMLADTMMPEAFEHGGKLVGLFTTLGFALAFALSALE
ncbi:MAG: ZIP family zinc transporter [Marmoricola sp.]